MTRIANQDFTLLRDDCRPLYFKEGDTIPEEYEQHWFVQHHTDDDEEVSDESNATQEKRKPGRPKTKS